MNGETTPGVSAGSKSVGAREKCRAQVICPSGAACASAGATNATASTPTRTCRVRRLIWLSPSEVDGSAAECQTLDIGFWHPAVHEVGDDACRAARHRPAHVAVAAVEEEISMVADTEDGRAGRRHRSEARAVRA